MTIPNGKSLKDCLAELKQRKPACACFESVIRHPLKIVENRFKCLSFYGIPVVVKPYPKEADLKFLNDAYFNLILPTILIYEASRDFKE